MTPIATQVNVDLLIRLWPVFVGSVLMVAWFIRLEAKVTFLKEKHDEETARKEKEAKALWDRLELHTTQNNNILKSVSRMEGKLEHRN